MRDDHQLKVGLTSSATDDTEIQKHVKITIVFFFKRLGSQGFHNLFSDLYFLFANVMKSEKQENLCEFFQIFEPCSLDDFYEYIMSMGLYNGKTHFSESRSYPLVIGFLYENIYSLTFEKHYSHHL